MSKLHLDFVDRINSVRPFAAGRREDRRHALVPSIPAARCTEPGIFEVAKGSAADGRRVLMIYRIA